MTGLFCFKVHPAALRSVLGPVRDRVDAALYLLNIAKVTLVSKCFERESVEADDTVVLHIGPRSRAFVIEEGRIVTMAFPFGIGVVAGAPFITLSGGAGMQLNSKIISQLQSMLTSLRDSAFLSFADHAMALDFVEDGRSELEEDVWPMFRDLILLEDGYLRYDHDTVRADGLWHPEHHIDAFYSSRASFKVGLYSGVTLADFQSILTAVNGCHYLAAWNYAPQGSRDTRLR